MVKVNHRGYKGYKQHYKDTCFIVWNGNIFNTKGDWYLDTTDTPHCFSEREMSRNFTSKKAAIFYMQYLIDKERNETTN